MNIKWIPYKTHFCEENGRGEHGDIVGTCNFTGIEGEAEERAKLICDLHNEST